MPGYAGSSWYFLRYMDPNNTETFCDRKASDYWNQVDVYVGGTEHAVGHLLYSRMWTKVLYDLGYIGFEEPFKKLVNQGMIGGISEKRYRKNILSNSEWILFDGERYSDPYSVNPEGLTNELEYFSWNISADIKSFFEDDSLSEINVPIKFVKNSVLDFQKYNTDSNKTNTQNRNIEIFLTKDGYYSSFTKQWHDLKTNAIINPCEFKTFQVGEKMSKRYGNVVNPDDVIKDYGADTFRMYEMFLGPVEQSKPWDTKGIEGVHRFLKKLWRLFYSIPSPLERGRGEVLWTNEKPTDAQYKILHKTIKKIEQDTENFSYNTAVAAFMISVNELTDAKCNSKEILAQILILLSPYAPHIAAELWQAMGCEGMILDAEYPKLEEKYLTEATKEYPVSINGKMRTAIVLATEVTEEEAKEAAMSTENITKWLEGKEVKKFIFVKGRMINIVV